MKSKLLSRTKNETEKRELKASFEAGAQFREELVRVLEGKISSSQAVALDPSGYSEPGWPYKQSDIIGYQRALKEIIDLCL